MAKIVHRGRVMDETGQPLMGANIVTINSTPKRGTITDYNGYFTVDGELGESFEITFMGFKSQIFRLDRYMQDRVYNLKEDAFALNEVVVTPRTPAPKPKSGFNLGGIFDAIGDIFGNVKPITTTTPPYAGSQLPIGYGTNPQYQQPAPETRSWISRNPLQAGGIALGLIALGAYAMKNNKKGSATTKKTGTPVKKSTPKAK